MLNKIQEVTDSSIKYGKKLIRKKALENIKDKLELLKKKRLILLKKK